MLVESLDRAGLGTTPMRRPRKPAKLAGTAQLTNAEALVKAARIERSTHIAVAIVAGLAAIVVACIGAGMLRAL